MTAADDLICPAAGHRDPGARLRRAERHDGSRVFAALSEYVPERDDSYRFDPDNALAILAGFKHNRRVMVQGYPRHG